MLSFDVVMPLHRGIGLSELKAAVDSILNQLVAPSKFFISVDGELNSDVLGYLDELSLSEKITIFSEPINLGPGRARDIAIRSSTAEWIALMDSDDISRPNRFQMQKAFVEETGADVVGGAIEEFSLIPGDLGFLRVMPRTHNQIIKLCKWRQPVNHVTLMFKRDVYLSVGGYTHIFSLEDFDFIVKLVISGATFANQNDVLVDVRRGSDFSKRRSGIRYFLLECSVLYKMYENGISNLLELGCAAFMRFWLRVLPLKVVTQLYRLLRS